LHERQQHQHRIESVVGQEIGLHRSTMLVSGESHGTYGSYGTYRSHETCHPVHATSSAPPRAYSSRARVACSRVGGWNARARAAHKRYATSDEPMNASPPSSSAHRMA